jgi:hypothetical protein
MRTDLAIIEPLPVPAPANPTPALPAWLNTMTADLAINQQPDATGRWVNLWTLSSSLPTPSQRLALERHRDQLAALLEQTPINNDNCAKRTFGLVAKLILAKPSRTSGPETTEARVETYNIALDDVPTWALAAAIRKWHRGQCDRSFEYRGGECVVAYDYRWAPESADLRKIALRETNELHCRVTTIDHIIAAVPFRDCAAERKKNLAAVAAILAEPATC